MKLKNLLKALRTLAIITLIIIPFVVWSLLFRAYHAEYDENHEFLIDAFLVSLLVPVLLFIHRKIDRKKYTNIKLLKWFSILFGSPLTFVFIGFYFSVFSMNFKYLETHSTQNDNYKVIKYQNFFKTKYQLIDLSVHTDTIEITVNRNNKLLELKLKNGSLEKELDFNDFKNKDLLKDRGLLKY